MGALRDAEVLRCVVCVNDDDEGILPREHGRGRRLPNALVTEEVEVRAQEKARPAVATYG